MFAFICLNPIQQQRECPHGLLLYTNREEGLSLPLYSCVRWAIKPMLPTGTPFWMSPTPIVSMPSAQCCYGPIWRQGHVEVPHSRRGFQMSTEGTENTGDFLTSTGVHTQCLQDSRTPGDPILRGASLGYITVSAASRDNQRTISAPSYMPIPQAKCSSLGRDGGRSITVVLPGGNLLRMPSSGNTTSFAQFWASARVKAMRVF